MMRPRRSFVQHVSQRGRQHDRHGRGVRSSVTGPYLPPLHRREDTFERLVAAMAHHLRGAFPDELGETRFEIATTPDALGERLERWRVDASANRITIYRIPIQRLARLHRNDEEHRRMHVEGCVIRAAAELLGKDPWELAPDDFGHF